MRNTKNLQNLINKAQTGGGKDRIASQHKKRKSLVPEKE